MDFVRSLISGQIQDSRVASDTGSPKEPDTITVHELKIASKDQISGLKSSTKQASLDDIRVMEKARDLVRKSGRVPAISPSGSHPETVSRNASTPKSWPDSEVNLGSGTSSVGGGDGFFGLDQGHTADWPTDLNQYRYLESLGRSPLGELWKAEVNGRPCSLKLINTFLTSGWFGEESPVCRLTKLRHPVLQPMTIIPKDDHVLALVTEANVPPLAQQLQRYTSGMPRDEVLGHLLDVAETLDELYRAQGLQHLGLNPRTSLLLSQRGAQIADMGLVELFWLPAGQPVAQMNGRYAAPELFQGHVSRACDQFSLAMIYHEMLTGVHPYGNISQRQMTQLRSTGKINLDLLPAPDRAVIARGLHPDPNQRYRTNTEMLEALTTLTGGGYQQRVGEREPAQIPGPRAMQMLSSRS